MSEYSGLSLLKKHVYVKEKFMLNDIYSDLIIDIIQCKVIIVYVNNYLLGKQNNTCLN